MTKSEVFELAEQRFINTPGYNCAQTVLTCIADYFGIESDSLKSISAPFGGGLSGIRVSVCGAVSGGLMAIGLLEKENKDIAGRELIDYVESKYDNINCDKILDIDFSNQRQVDSEKEVKKKSICMPLIKDVCEWLIARYDK